MHLSRTTIGLTAGALALGTIASAALAPAGAQPAPAAPPAVGVIEAVKRPVTESSEFLGRIEATNGVSVVARVTAFLEKRTFNEGAEVKTGDLLYQLERGPFEADLEVEEGSGPAVAGNARERQADDGPGQDPARRPGRSAIDL